MPDRPSQVKDEMTYQEAWDKGFYKYDLRQELMRLYERDCAIIREDTNTKKE